jgi:hypothetical protein
MYWFLNMLKLISSLHKYLRLFSIIQFDWFFRGAVIYTAPCAAVLASSLMHDRVQQK